jgi:hypothetical protein
MNARTKLNLLLVILVAVLGALAYFQPGIEQAQVSPTLSSLKPDEVATIRIEPASTDSVAFARRDGKWWMTEPVQAPANELRMQGVLRITGTESKRRYPVTEVELARVGLDQPEVKLFLNDTLAVAFGDTEPLGQQRYVRTGDTVHLIEDTGYYHVVGAYTTFLDPTLLPEGVHIEAITLPGLRITRVDGHWQLKPAPAKFSADQVNALLEEWRHAQALEVQRYEGGKPQGEVVIRIKDRTEPLRFGIMSRAHGVVLARADLGLQYQLPEDAVQRLLTLPPMPAEAPATAQ